MAKAVSYPSSPELAEAPKSLTASGGMWPLWLRTWFFLLSSVALWAGLIFVANLIF